MQCKIFCIDDNHSNLLVYREPISTRIVLIVFPFYCGGCPVDVDIIPFPLHILHLGTDVLYTPPNGIVPKPSQIGHFCHPTYDVVVFVVYIEGS